VPNQSLEPSKSGDAVADRRVTPDEARRLVVEPSDIELWRLASALDRTGAALAGNVAPALVADILEVGEPENWPRTTRAVESGVEPFRPLCTMPKDDGNVYRSWLPSDLGADDEERVRAFASASKNEFVRARVFEVLWVRFKKFPDVTAAIDARFASAKLTDPETNWPRMVKNLGRLTTLVLAVSAKARLPELVTALDEAAGRLVACSRPFSFPVLADMVCNTLLTKSNGRDVFTAERGKAWDKLLSDTASTHRGDPHHGHDALMVLQAWRARWGDHDGAQLARRDVVANLQEAAKNSPPMIATTHAQRALQAALDFGLADLSDSLRNGLMGAIKEALPEFKQISGTFTVPKELLATIDALLTANPRLPGAIRELAILPGLLEVDIDALRDSAREQLKDSPFAALVPTEQFHADGKVTFRSNDFEGNLERHVAFGVGTHLVLVEAIVGYFLRSAIARFEQTTLLDALASRPHLPPHRAALLAVAAERFASRDFVSSGVIVLTVYEAVLRDLVRALGYPALKVERGIQMDETLSSLLRAEPTQAVLGPAHTKLAEYVLCDPELGWNLRNEIAHGTIHADALTPTRVLLGWLLVVRLTCFVATSPRGQSTEEVPADPGATVAEGPPPEDPEPAAADDAPAGGLAE
jgi:hypothetical protein